jgi:PAS domain S-box-containing protein
MTEPKEEAAGVTRREQQCQLLEQYMQDLFWMTDLEWRVTYLTPSVQTMLGWTVAQASEQPFPFLFTEASFAKLKDAYAEAANDLLTESGPAPRRTLELEMNRQDGSTLWADVQVAIFRQPDGTPAGYLGVARDVTHRKEMDHMNQFMVGRELKMLELKEANQELKKQLKALRQASS